MWLVALVAWQVPVAAGASELDSIAIILEEGDGKKQDDLVVSVASAAFVDSQRFQVIERSTIDAILKEHDFQTYVGEDAQRIGRLAGADYLALVSYTSQQRKGLDTYRLRTRVVSVATGQLRATIGGAGNLLDRLGSPTVEDAGQRLLAGIKSKFPVQGYVLKIAGDEVIVDLGKTDGIRKGDKLQVVRFGEPIPHPEQTGVLIPGEERLVGVVKVETVTDTTALCTLRKGPLDPEVGDRARFIDDGPI